MAIDYIMIGSNDFGRSRAFYDAVIPHLGGKFSQEFPGAFSYKLRDGKRIWIAKPYDKNAATAGNGLMIGFDAGSEASVDAAYAAALASGGTDEGAPGPRPLYGPEFYGGYVRDPDGNKMSFVFMRKTPRTA